MKENRLIQYAVAGIVLVAVILIIGTIWVGRSASKSTDEAVHSVSLFYLNELAGRREQVIESNLNTSINNISIAIAQMDADDRSDSEHFQSYMKRIEELYGLDKFAFVDTNGLIYTSDGTEKNIDNYPFDYRNLSSADISIKNVESTDKSVVIALPIENLTFDGKRLNTCFIEINMNKMLAGVSMNSSNNDTTFCNIYTSDGIALTNVVLGGLSSERNLLEAMRHAEFDEGYSEKAMISDFKKGEDGVVSFTYNGINETLYYVPVHGTDWMLTYLIRESVLSDQFSTVSRGIVKRSLIQTLLTVLVLLAMFILMLTQMRRSSRLVIEKETAEAENRIKQQELEQRLELQEQLLQQEKQRVEQDKMITALASDYRSVYYVDLDTDEGICYRTDLKMKYAMKEGMHFPYLEKFKSYADQYVNENYREGFLEFIEPDNIKRRLEDELILTYRYLVNHDGEEKFEMLRVAGVRHAEDRPDHMVHAIGIGFTDVDKETREDLSRNQALSDALTLAEEANKAKTAFLSNMSHEIRTPMNAIIGLDNIAMNDPETSEKTKEYLQKIDASAQHLLTLINDILDMSRIESGKMVLKNEEFSFSRLLEQINTMVSGQCNDKGLEYNCRIDGDIDEYYIGDDMKLRQVIINILGNAVKFTPVGGKIDFIVERVAQFEGKSTLRLTMKDTGIGMDAEFIGKIFDAFSQEDSSTTSKYGSSGLGMAITKNIVEMMNGNIVVESEKGVGSTFIVTVTLMDSETDGIDGDYQMRPNEMSVLIIDDDPVACDHAKMVLEKVGISSEIALSGMEAIDMVRLRSARRDPYNLILVDWKMPEMDGLETTRQIRSVIGSESAIIILTAYNWDEILDDAVSAGVDSFIAKPLFASNVLDEFKNALIRKNIASEERDRKADLHGRKILLAEDVQVNAEIIMMLLAMKEMDVDHAENGKIAVDMFTEHEAGYYDAILMDMRMPEMDGLTATQKIRALDREDAKTIPIIALTANAFDEDVQNSLQAGLNAHLVKPVEPDNLFSTLESLIRD